MRGHTRPRVMWRSSFVDDFQVGSDSVFGVDILVNWNCGRWPILASALKAVSLIISESSAPQFSVMIRECTGTVRAYDTNRQVGKQFRGLLPSRQRLSFRC